MSWLVLLSSFQFFLVLSIVIISITRIPSSLAFHPTTVIRQHQVHPKHTLALSSTSFLDSSGLDLSSTIETTTTITSSSFINNEIIGFALNSINDNGTTIRTTASVTLSSSSILSADVNRWTAAWPGLGSNVADSLRNFMTTGLTVYVGFVGFVVIVLPIVLSTLIFYLIGQLYEELKKETLYQEYQAKCELGEDLIEDRQDLWNEFWEAYRDQIQAGYIPPFAAKALRPLELTDEEITKILSELLDDLLSKED